MYVLWGTPDLRKSYVIYYYQTKGFSIKVYENVYKTYTKYENIFSKFTNRAIFLVLNSQLSKFWV